MSSKIAKTLKANPKLSKILVVTSVVAFAFIGLFVAQNHFIASNNDSGSTILGVSFNNNISGFNFGSGNVSELTLSSSYDHSGVKWSSSDSDIVHILSSTKRPGNVLVTFIKPGKATITATLKNGDKVSSGVNIYETYTYIYHKKAINMALTKH